MKLLHDQLNQLNKNLKMKYQSFLVADGNDMKRTWIIIKEIIGCKKSNRNLFPKPLL